MWGMKEFYATPNNIIPSGPGVYIFAGQATDYQGVLQWRSYYIGETHDFSQRIPNHEKWQPALLLGATHTFYRVVEDEAERKRLEGWLIRVYDPELNKT